MTYPSRTAEAVTFRERFTNAATVHANGGTLVNSPAVKDGVILNGTNQYAVYAIDATDLGRPEVSIVAEFVPSFEADDDQQHFICDTSPSLQYSLFKQSNNSLNAYVGGSVFGVALGSYQAYWKVGEKNILIVTASSSSRSLYLNGNLLITSGTYAPTFTSTALHVGRRSIGSDYFPGRILSVSTHATQLLWCDVSAIQNESLFTYPNRSEIWVPMRSAVVDGSNNRTLDESRHGRDLILGDGAGNFTPAFLSPGLELDGTKKYLRLNSAGDTFNHDEIVISMLWRARFGADGSSQYLFDSDSSNRYLIAKTSADTFLIFLGGAFLMSIAASVWEPYWREGGKNVVTVFGKSGDSKLRINGKTIAISATAWTKKSPSFAVWGTDYSTGGNYVDGDLLGAYVLPFYMSDIQLRDFENLLME